MAIPVAITQADLDQFAAVLQQIVQQLGPSTQQPRGTTTLLPGGLEQQTPWESLTSNVMSGTGLLGPRRKPSGYNSVIVDVQVAGGTINCQGQDSPDGGAVSNCTDSNGTQAAISNKRFQIDGIQNFFGLNITSVSAGAIVQAVRISYTNATRPQAATDTGTVAQGSPNSVANGWPVQITDLTSVVGIDNSTALRASQYAKGSGIAGDTAVRVAGANFGQIKGVAVTAGTPVSVRAPAAGKKFVAMKAWVSVSQGAAVLFQDASGTEFARTPMLLANTPFLVDFGNGYKSTTANNALFIDVAPLGGGNPVVTVHGDVIFAGDE